MEKICVAKAQSELKLGRTVGDKKRASKSILIAKDSAEIIYVMRMVTSQTGM